MPNTLTTTSVALSDGVPTDVFPAAKTAARVRVRLPDFPDNNNPVAITATGAKGSPPVATLSRDGRRVADFRRSEYSNLAVSATATGVGGATVLVDVFQWDPPATGY
jgi:hypothetical protein